MGSNKDGAVTEARADAGSSVQSLELELTEDTVLRARIREVGIKSKKLRYIKKKSKSLFMCYSKELRELNAYVIIETKNVGIISTF